MPIRLIPVALAATLLASAVTVRASVVLEYSLEQMVTLADGIIHARVIDQRSEWSELSIVTEIELEVVACYKGPYEVGERVTILQHGGVVGDLAMVVPGAPTFASGEEVVLFLEEHAQTEAPLVMGLAQGKFTVVVDATTHERVVTRDLAGLTLVESNGTTTRAPLAQPPEVYTVPTPDAAPLEQLTLTADPVWIPLDTFTAEIARIIDRAAGR